MKNFNWPLQRLLDVKGKQEHAMRAELAAITEQSAALRSRIMMEKNRPARSAGRTERAGASAADEAAA